MCGNAWPASCPMRRLLARCVSMNVRCAPANLQNGCSAFTTPAPCVQRLPTPAASVTTASSPRASAARPAWRNSSASGCVAFNTSASNTSLMSALAGRRFCAMPMRPFFKSSRICSCCTRSKPFCSSSSARLCWRPFPVFSRGSKRSNKVCIMPENSGRVRQAALKRSSSARWGLVSACGSARSQRGTCSA